MYRVTLLGNSLQLLPEKAIYVDSLKALLVSDVHLGKSETFQRLGVPVSSSVNRATLERLSTLCSQFEVETVWILGDLFHSKFALVNEVVDEWLQFIASVKASVQLVIGNHDRTLTARLEDLSIQCIQEAIQIDNLILSHEPTPHQDCLNICGHIHPCVRLKSGLDTLRLPCFFWDASQNLLVLPSFGEFTGGHEVLLTAGSTAFAIAEDAVIPFEGKGKRLI